MALVYQSQGFEKAHKKWIEVRQKSNLPLETRQLAEEMVKEEHKLLGERQEKTVLLAGIVEALALGGMAIAVGMVVLTGMAYGRENRIRERSNRATKVAHDQLASTLADIEKEHASTRALADFAGLLQSCHTSEEIAKVSMHSLKKILQGTRGTFYLMRVSGDHAEAFADWDDVSEDGVVQEERHRPESIPPSNCWALRQGRPFRSKKGELGCSHTENYEGSFSTCVPMTAQGTEVGLLFIEHGETWSGTPMAEAVSEQLALAITNLRLRETLRTQSLRDPLTGLSNRREIDEQLPKEIARHARNAQPMCLFVLDIDHFKRFNDTFGHDAGDAVLREFAHTVKKFMRTEDIVARLGGEEFIVALPNTPLDQAKILAVRVREQVSQMDVSFKGSSLGKVTTSIGVAEFPKHGPTVENLIAAADAALYQAKGNGRNRVETAGSICVINPPAPPKPSPAPKNP